jgi:hypothetical protein
LGDRHQRGAQRRPWEGPFPGRCCTRGEGIQRATISDDPVSLVIGKSLPGFDGALYRAPAGKKGWGIFYNDAISSEGRINFTLGHEFGHYLIHRLAYPDGIRCGEQDVVRWDSEYGQIEHQANVFSAGLLMPFDDFRRQIPEGDKVDLDMISHCADRYRVSLIAAVLRWLQYTTRRAVLVVSREGYILWSRASKPALRTGAFFRTSGPPVPIPSDSLAGRQDMIIDGRAGVALPSGVWFPEPVREMTIFAEQYDFAVTLLLLENEYRYSQLDREPEEDVYDRFTSQT